MIMPCVSANMVAVYKTWAASSDQAMITAPESLYNYSESTAIELVAFPLYPAKE
jgi:hypothetical protein